MIEFRLMQHALAVAKFGSFHRAADSLYLTQPTLTRSIKALEEELGVKIFDRGKRRVEPTPLGRIFLVRAAVLMEAASEMKREIDLAQGLEIGHLEIGTGVLPAESLVAPAVGRLSKSHPRLFIEVIVNTWGVLVELLRSQKVEFFVAETSEVEMDPGLSVTPLRVLKGYFYCRQGHPLTKRPQTSLRETLEYPLVMGKMPRRILDSIDAICGMTMRTGAPDRQLPIIKCELRAGAQSSDRQ